MEKKRSEPRSDIADDNAPDRRTNILRALHRCIFDKGYTKTSLTDIAVSAGMSPSHIRYYFQGKDAILESYLAHHCEQVLAGIRAIPNDNPMQWLKDFSDWFIGHPLITSSRLSVMVEIFGISVHDPALRKIKTAYDEEIRSILQHFFERVECADGLSPAMAAEIAQALEAGIKYNGVFQQDFNADHACEMFLVSLERLVAAR